ncbi:MAG: threonylcarbamoyl-AMP synthase, partial [Clostridiales bacterium]|nr:threonylcarbamoyl-AMP synthase [Clostridiales bacterium]
MNTRVVTIDPDRIEPALIAEAAECLRGGGLVAFPTETVYGLGADALNESAFRAIFAAKGRPNDNPIILHISNTDALETLAAEVPEYAARLMRSFWPGPLTIVLKKRAGLPDYVTAGLDTVAVRMPSHPIALALIREAGRPVAAPSANRSGKPSPTRAEHVARDLSGKVDMIVDGGAAGIGLESTVVDATGGGGAPVVILRPGGVSREAIAAVVGAGNVAGAREEADRCCAAGAGSGDAAAADVGAGMSALTGPPADAPPISPGTKYRHYAP